MWEGGKPSRLPRTKGNFYITSTKRHKFFVKPGKAFVHKQDEWAGVRATALLNNKIDRVVVSPNGMSSLHIPKVTGLLAVHLNCEPGTVITLPLPRAAKLSNGARAAIECVSPYADPLVMTCPYQRIGDVPFVFGYTNTNSSDFAAHVSGIAVSESGKALALAVNHQLWIWQQYPEEQRGVGFWTDLTGNQRLYAGPKANHVLSQNGRVVHGFMRPRQCFTLDSALAPNVPENSAISYQDLTMFDNPDEGVGVCCVTALLPPSKPYDTMYIFNAICVFKGATPSFQRADVTIPIHEGGGTPCVWWSLDCRILVMAVSKSLVIMTRFLRIIAVVPIGSVFHDPETIVSSVSWSCNGQFFLITAMTGEIAGVTRSGRSLRHNLCHLTPFQRDAAPLMLTGDAKDPSHFVVYSTAYCRELRIELSIVPQNLLSLMSLHFPQKSAACMWDETIEAIQENGFVEPISLIRLMYLVDMFRIWPYQSPLRTLLWSLVEKGIGYLLETGQDVLAVFMVRCVWRVTGQAPTAYDPILARLGSSDDPTMLLVKKIMQGELDKIDYVTSRIMKANRIWMYEPTGEDDDARDQITMPDHGRGVDLLGLIIMVKRALYEEDYDYEEMVDGVNMRLLFEIMAEYGRFEKAIAFAQHPSLSCDMAQTFIRIASVHPNSPEMVFGAMHACIRASPTDEDDIRALCLTVLVNILKQQIANTTPTADDPSMKRLSSLVMIEERLDVVTPQNDHELRDFSVIIWIAFAVADYPNCIAYLRGMTNKIPDPLRRPVRELFSLVWFVRWRFCAITDSIRHDRANNGTLRLLAFPEFVNRKAALSQIVEAGEAVFSPDAYQLYVSGSNLIEQDPVFPDFVTECAQIITARNLTRVATATMRFASDVQEIPRAGIILSFIVSHMVPWLRCGIPRALVHLECNEIVPSELLDFGTFRLPGYRRKMEVVASVVAKTIPEPEPKPVKRPPKVYIAPPEEEDSSEGEYIPPPRVPKAKKRTRKRRRPSNESLESEDDRPPLHLLSLGPPAYREHVHCVPTIQPSYRSEPFTPVWDYQPGLWREPQPDEPAPVVLKPRRRDPPPPKRDPPPRRKDPKKPKKERPVSRPDLNLDLFDQDSDLHRRAGHHIDNPGDGGRHDEPPTFVRRPRDRPPKGVDLDTDPSAATNDRVDARPTSSRPVWHPHLVSMLEGRVVGVQSKRKRTRGVRQPPD